MTRPGRAAALLLPLVALLLAAALADPPRDAGAQRALLDFALMGDTPYNVLEEIAFEAMMKDIDSTRLAFVVHVGDFKSSRQPCSDELFRQRLGMFNASAHPFIFIFGDNEWTDCHYPRAGGHDPVERLARLRELFAAGPTSLGRRTLPLTRQSEDASWARFRENVRWVHGGVVFVGFNMPGSNNNWGRSVASDREWAERNAANIAWLRAGFAEAVQRGAPGVLLALQANPFFERPRGSGSRGGYEAFLAALEREVIAFGKPVAFVHGDTHRFRVDRPLHTAGGQLVENFTRLEVYGSPVVGWVRGRVDPDDPRVFSFRSELLDRLEDRTRP